MAKGEVFGTALELMPNTSLGDTEIALQVKVLAIKSDKPEFGPQNSHGLRSEPTPEIFL